MPDPVAWVVIEPGWKVVASDGSDVGRVEEVVGDENVDIFDGLVVSSSLFGRSKKYVPSEQVGDIYTNEVHLKLTPDEIERLGEYEEAAASEQIEPVDAPNPIVRALKRAFFLDRE
jgi:hypothetical protein